MADEDRQQQPGGQVWRDPRVGLLAGLLLLMLVYPALAAGGLARFAVGTLFTLIAVFAAMSVFSARRLFIVIAVAAGITSVLGWIREMADAGWFLSLSADLLVAAVGFFLVGALLRNVFLDADVTAGTICNAISGYIVTGIAWAATYRVLTSLDHIAFATMAEDGIWSDYLYQSFVVLTTLGLGDIVPVTPMARALTSLEAVIGQMYIAVVIAGLVGIYIARHGPGERR
jgi:hypothetical protein